MNQTVLKVLNKMSEHSPVILTCLGTTGFVTTVIFASKATPKAIEAMQENHLFTYSEISKKEQTKEYKWNEIKVFTKEVVPHYIPTIIMGTMSLTCFIGSNSVNANRRAAIAGAYAISETTLKEYQDKIEKEFGEGKATLIKDNVAKAIIDNNPPDDDLNYIDIQSDDILCYDILTGRYFKSNTEKLKSIELELNKNLYAYEWVSVNDFYYAVGLRQVKMGDDLGWDLNDTGDVEFDYSSQLTDKNVPCLVVNYNFVPRFRKEY